MGVRMRNGMYGVGFLMIMLSLTATVSAGSAAVPEVDGGSLSTGLGLLAGGMLLLRARLGRK